MNKQLSIYLDATRFMAAVWVAVAHLVNFHAVDPATFWWLPQSGRDAVVIFFVISGFVIDYTAQKQRSTVTEFAVSRAARIYSVAFPALLLTVLLDLFCMQWDASSYAQYQYEKLWFYIPFHLAFLGEIWNISEQPFTIGPYWSLGYEVWYYVLFTAAFFYRGWRRWLFAGLTFLFVGYKLWLLLPVWLSGVVLHRVINRVSISRGWAYVLFFGSIGLYALYKTLGLDEVLHHLPNQGFADYEHSPLGSAKKFLSDYLVCALFVMNIIGFVNSGFQFGQGVSHWIRLLASYTFTLYLIHAPLYRNAEFHLHYDRSSPFTLLTFLLVVGVATWLFSFISEKRKDAYKRFLTRLVDWLIRPRMRESIFGRFFSPRVSHSS